MTFRSVVLPSIYAGLRTILLMSRGILAEPLLTLPMKKKACVNNFGPFVQSLMRRVKTDKRGNPLMSADGTLVTEPHLINTYELLTSEDFEDCLASLYFPLVFQLLVFLPYSCFVSPI
jgi:hypothetical protein